MSKQAEIEQELKNMKVNGVDRVMLKVGIINDYGKKKVNAVAQFSLQRDNSGLLKSGKLSKSLIKHLGYDLKYCGWFEIDNLDSNHESGEMETGRYGN